VPLACPNGASPNQTGVAQDFLWAGWNLLNSDTATKPQELYPWLPGAFLPTLVSAADICAKAPQLPEPLTKEDILSISVPTVFGGTLSGAGIAKIQAYIAYAAYQYLCECTSGVVNPCQATTIALSTSTNMCYAKSASGYVWPSADRGVVQTTTKGMYLWDFGCPVVDVFVDTVPHIPNLVINPLHIYDGANIDHGAETQAGGTMTVTLSPVPGSTTQTGISLIICTFDNGARPNWTVTITPHAGQGPIGNTPPDPPTIINITVPPAPPLVCDNNTICQLLHGIGIQQNTNINITTSSLTEILSSTPSTYVPGNSYQVAGSGVQVVAQGTLGVVAEIVSIPPSFVPSASDPPRYYDIGWLMMGAADALDGKKWIHSTGDRFIPAFPEVDRVHYNLAAGVSINIVELLPPPPPSSSSA